VTKETLSEISSIETDSVFVLINNISLEKYIYVIIVQIYSEFFSKKEFYSCFSETESVSETELLTTSTANPTTSSESSMETEIITSITENTSETSTVFTTVVQLTAFPTTEEG
jgi:hypothetical protein